MRESSILFGLLLADFLEVLGEGDLESLLVVLVKAVFLEGVEGDGGLQDVLEVNKAKQVLATTDGGLLDKADALEAGEGAEDV